MISATPLLVLLGLLLVDRGAEAALALWDDGRDRVSGGQDLQTDHEFEVRPGPPRGALEEGLRGPVLALYGRAIQSLRGGQDQEALLHLRQARGLQSRVLLKSAPPAQALLAARHFTRIAYAEEQISELCAVERALSRRRIELTPEEQAALLHDRALLNYNKFLLVRSFTGRADERLLALVVRLFDGLVARPGTLRPLVLVHYAALWAERGDRRAAQRALSRVSAEDLAAEPQDLAVAYYHLAQGDRRRAMSRLLQAAQREAWDRPQNAREGRTLRTNVYRMNDFDALRDHPLFQELVTRPEEAARALGEAPR